MALGESCDLDQRGKLRLSILHRAAQLVLGPELHRAGDPARRLLQERLGPVVAQLMTEEDEVRWPPALGLRLSGAQTEWAMLGCSSLAEHFLEEFIRPFSGAAVLLWRGRVVAATPSWQQVHSLDRGLLLAMANKVGPQAYGEERSLALEELDGLWVRRSGEGSIEEIQHDMFNLRLYPEQKYIPPELHDRISDARKREEASLVLSLLAPSQACKDQHITLPAVREAALTCSKQGSLPFLWQKLLTGKVSDPLSLGRLSSAILLDERTGDVVSFPSLTFAGRDLGDISAALRRTVHWFHALPPLSASTPERFVCCEGYIVAAARREDGILCWACSEMNPEIKDGI